MVTLVRSRGAAWAILACIIAAAAVVVWLSPAEQTLGEGVKIVYVHVALTRAGTLGLHLAGLLGLAVLLTGRQPLHDWTVAVGWAGLGLLAGGFLVSLLAQAVSWGGIAWQEPRVSSALSVLAVALIVYIGGGWLPHLRVRGALAAALVAYMTWANERAGRVLHPGDAIGSSSSSAIQLSAWGLLILSVLLGAWIVWQLRRAQKRRVPLSPRSASLGDEPGAERS